MRHKLVLTGTIFLAFGLGATLGIFIGSKRLAPLADSSAPWSPTTIHERSFVGVWRSRDPKGTRMILTYNGEFVVTRNGVPLGRVGTWRIEGNKLYVDWALDEEYAERITSYTASLENNFDLLVMSPPLITPTDPSEFVRDKS